MTDKQIKQLAGLVAEEVIKQLEIKEWITF
jgi:hypothetical protein